MKATVSSRVVVRMARVAVPLGVVNALVFAYLAGLRGALSAALGCGAMVLNFWALATLVDRILGEGSGRAAAAILLALKMLALVTVVGVLLSRGMVLSLPFTAGLSVAVLSMVLAGSGAQPPPEDEAPPSDGPKP